ncbi:MAG: TnsA endonuclease N-terminal domain-containing protein [Bacillota bacterium]
MENKKPKKIICFICSQECFGEAGWKNHIIENHTEWDEYLLCPLCRVPCRDIKSHFAVHHKFESIPEMKQYKVSKLYDWTKKYQRQKKKKSKWKAGTFDSIKMGKQIHYRSSWERDVMICLEKCADVDEYYGDDHLCIKYQMSGKWHRYWPDFTVKMRNNDVYVLEIKPMDQTQWVINKVKWAFAQSYCESKQWNFQVWTQKHIRKIKTRAIRADVLLTEHVFPSKEEVLKEIQID